MERSDDAALKRVEEGSDKLVKVRQSYDAFRAACGKAETLVKVRQSYDAFRAACGPVRQGRDARHGRKLSAQTPAERLRLAEATSCEGPTTRAIRRARRPPIASWPRVAKGQIEQMDVDFENYFNAAEGGRTADRHKGEAKA
jgi:hypothetical protein